MRWTTWWLPGLGPLGEACLAAREPDLRLDLKDDLFGERRSRAMVVPLTVTPT